MEAEPYPNDFIVKQVAANQEQGEAEPYPNDFIVKQIDANQEQGEAETRRVVQTIRRGKRLLPGLHRRGYSLRAEHRRRLDSLLHTFMCEHRWKEAAGVLSVLLRWASLAPNVLDDDLRRYHTVAMELHRRFFSSEDRRYDMWIKQIFDMWMSSLSCSKDESRKKNLLLMELALFHFTQGNIDEAYSMMQYVIQDDDLAKEPSVNLLHGMILYQLWYSGLPEEFELKGSNTYMPTGTFGARFQEMEISESLNEQYAAVSEDVKFPSQYASESSFGNEKVFMGCNNDGLKTNFGVAPRPQEFYVSQSTDRNEENFGSHNLDDNLRNSSIFFAHGLDTSLLPIHLEHLTGDVNQIIHQYRSLVNEHYRDAVKHLRLALHSIHPVYAALLPLVQLLLLGDRVGEAFKELENSCHNMDTALPFRLMATLLECFQSNKVTEICSYYEKALKMDPICYYSLERLVKMHKSGDCSTMLMFEMIVLHLDAADGQCSIWQEFASCFLQLQTAAQSEYEDCTSKNQQGEGTCTISSIKIPIALMEKNARGSWKLRLAWWKRRHFSNSSLSAQVGDWKILCFKAACASHLYGPAYEYVLRVSKILREDLDHFSILNTHMQKAMNLFEHL